uniref:Uncharacterized protein n=1 Tax=Oryza glaberrima TaxID=4538 RepID=I1QXY6_ORYGL
MGILAYLFLLVVAIIGVFAVLASLLDPIHGFYLRSIKEALEWAEFIFTWTSSLYFILPIERVEGAKGTWRRRELGGRDDGGVKHRAPPALRPLVSKGRRLLVPEVHGLHATRLRVVSPLAPEVLLSARVRRRAAAVALVPPTRTGFGRGEGYRKEREGVFFSNATNWASTFYDCFTPLTLWLEGIYSGIVLLLFVLFIGNLDENWGRIMIEFSGVAIQMAGIFCFVMIKVSRDDNYTMKEAQKQSIMALVIFKIFSFIILTFIKAKLVPTEDNVVIPRAFAAIGCLIQFVLMLSSPIGRWLDNNFNDDEPTTRKIKLSAALIRLITLSFDCWLFTVRGYWSSPLKKPLAEMTATNLVFTSIVVVCRYIGPNKLRNFCVDIWNWLRAVPEKLQGKWNSFIQWKTDNWTPFTNTVKVALQSFCTGCCTMFQTGWNALKNRVSQCIEDMWNILAGPGGMH